MVNDFLCELYLNLKVPHMVWLLLPDFNPGNVIRQLGSGAKLETIFS